MPSLLDDSLKWISRNVCTSTLVQEGPKCGLVALCMASSLLDLPLEMEEVYQRAKDKQYTIQGEMFSASNMVCLSECVGLKPMLLEYTDKSRLHVMSHLLNGHPILVPYDSDFNHEPCLKKGHKAHWAVLTGAVLIVQNAPPEYLCTLKQESSAVDFMYCPQEHNTQFSVNDLENLVIKQCYVYAKQGKSKHLALWCYNDLMASNRNLKEMDPKRGDDGTDYIVPDGELIEGLCSKIVILHRAN